MARPLSVGVAAPPAPTTPQKAKGTPGSSTGGLRLTIDQIDIDRLVNYGKLLDVFRAQIIAEAVNAKLKELGEELSGVIEGAFLDESGPSGLEMQWDSSFGGPPVSLYDSIGYALDDTAMVGEVSLKNLFVGIFPQATPETDKWRSQVNYAAPLILGSSPSGHPPPTNRLYYWMASKLGLEFKRREMKRETGFLETLEAHPGLTTAEAGGKEVETLTITGSKEDRQLIYRIYTKIWKGGTRPHNFLIRALRSGEWMNSVSQAEKDLAEILEEIVDVQPQQVAQDPLAALRGRMNIAQTARRAIPRKRLTTSLREKTLAERGKGFFGKQLG